MQSLIGLYLIRLLLNINNGFGSYHWIQRNGDNSKHKNVADQNQKILFCCDIKINEVI